MHAKLRRLFLNLAAENILLRYEDYVIFLELSLQDTLRFCAYGYRKRNCVGGSRFDWVPMIECGLTLPNRGPPCRKAIGICHPSQEYSRKRKIRPSRAASEFIKNPLFHCQSEREPLPKGTSHENINLDILQDSHHCMLYTMRRISSMCLGLWIRVCRLSELYQSEHWIL